MWQTVYELQMENHWFEDSLFLMFTVLITILLINYLLNLVRKKSKLSFGRILLIAVLCLISFNWWLGAQDVKEQENFIMDKVENQLYDYIIEGEAEVRYARNEYTIEVEDESFFVYVGFSEMKIPKEGLMRVFLVDVPVEELDGSIYYVKETVRVDVYRE